MWIPVSGIYRPVRGSEPRKYLSEESRQTAYGISKRDSRGRINGRIFKERKMQDGIQTRTLGRSEEKMPIK